MKSYLSKSKIKSPQVLASSKEKLRSKTPPSSNKNSSDPMPFPKVDINQQTVDFKPKIKNVKVTSEKRTISKNVAKIEKIPDFDPSAHIQLDSQSNSSIKVNHHISISENQSNDDNEEVLFQKLLNLKSKKQHYIKQLDIIEDQLYQRKISPEEFQNQLNQINTQIVDYTNEIEKIQEKLNK